VILSPFDIDQRARKCLARSIPDDWTISPPTDDVGLDYWLQITEHGAPVGLNCFLQLKGTQSHTSESLDIAFRLRTDRLLQYLSSTAPVLLVGCWIAPTDPNDDEARFCVIRDYVGYRLEPERPDTRSWLSQKTVSIVLSPQDALTPEVCRQQLRQYLEIDSERNIQSEDRLQRLFRRCRPLAVAVSNMDSYLNTMQSQMPLESRTLLKQFFITGTILQESGKHKDAISYFTRAHHLAPTPMVCLSLTFSFEAIGDLANMLTIGLQGLGLENDNPYLLSNVGTACFYLGDIQNAFAYHERAIRIEPTDAFLLMNAAATLEYLATEIMSARRQETLERARGYYERANMLRPNDDLILMDLGLVLFKLCRFRNTCDVLEQAVRANPRNYTAQIRLARAYVMTQGFDRARQIVDNLIRYGVSTKDVLQIKRMLPR